MPPILKLKKFLNIIEEIDENILLSFQKLNIKEKRKFFEIYADKEKKIKLIKFLEKENIIDEDFFKFFLKKIE